MGLKKVKVQVMNTCLTLQSCNRTCTNPVSKESVKENCSGKESSDSEEDTSKIGNTLVAVFLWQIQTNVYSCRKHLLLG